MSEPATPPVYTGIPETVTAMPKAKRCSDQAGKLVGWQIFCPGCERKHVIPASWTFNGDYDAPSFTPSVKCDWPWWGESNEPQCCHSVITDGKIEFCLDSTHKLKGKKVPLPDLEGTTRF